MREAGVVVVRWVTKSADVLRRMRAGDCPTAHGLRFADGARASHAVMVRLRRAGKANAPQGGSVDTPWTLTEVGRA